MAFLRWLGDEEAVDRRKQRTSWLTQMKNVKKIYRTSRPMHVNQRRRDNSRE